MSGDGNRRIRLDGYSAFFGGGVAVAVLMGSLALIFTYVESRNNDERYNSLVLQLIDGNTDRIETLTAQVDAGKAWDASVLQKLTAVGIDMEEPPDVGRDKDDPVQSEGGDRARSERRR